MNCPYCNGQIDIGEKKSLKCPLCKGSIVIKKSPEKIVTLLKKDEVQERVAEWEKQKLEKRIQELKKYMANEPELYKRNMIQADIFELQRNYDSAWAELNKAIIHCNVNPFCGYALSFREVYVGMKNLLFRTDKNDKALFFLFLIFYIDFSEAETNLQKYLQGIKNGIGSIKDNDYNEIVEMYKDEPTEEFIFSNFESCISNINLEKEKTIFYNMVKKFGRPMKLSANYDKLWLKIATVIKEKDVNEICDDRGDRGKSAF